MKLLLILIAATTLCAQGAVSVTGRMTDSVTNLPIEQASITLDQGSYHELLFTDAGGNFAFDEVPLGTATIKIRKENYIPFETTNPEDTSFEITTDHHERNFKLTPAAKIRSHITGEGKPDEAIEVELLKEDYGAGFRQYVPYAHANGGLGQEASFEFTGLEPGRYIVRANPASVIGTVRELLCSEQNEASACVPVVDHEPEDRNEGYTATWYPGTTTLADAAPITLNAGETQTADFKIAQQHLFHISGKLTLPETQSGLANLVLYGNGLGIGLALTNDGEFRFRGLPPGQYTLRAITGLSGRVKRDIVVTDHDLEGITLVPQPPLQIVGRFITTNADAKLPAGLSVQFGPALPADSASIEAEGTGTFILSGFPDDYSLQPIVPAGDTVTEIRYAGINYLNQLIPIHGDTADPSIAIVLSNQPATISGSIDDESKAGELKPEAKIVLTPWPLPENFDLRSLRVAVTDKQGTFSFHGLAPGKYKTAVLTGDDRKRDHDLTILNDKFSAADTFELTAGQNLTITPKP